MSILAIVLCAMLSGVMAESTSSELAAIKKEKMLSCEALVIESKANVTKIDQFYNDALLKWNNKFDTLLTRITEINENISSDIDKNNIVVSKYKEVSGEILSTINNFTKTWIQSGIDASRKYLQSIETNRQKTIKQIKDFDQRYTKLNNCPTAGDLTYREKQCIKNKKSGCGITLKSRINLDEEIQNAITTISNFAGPDLEILQNELSNKKMKLLGNGPI